MSDLQIPTISFPLPWHVGAWEQLQKQLQGETLPHALVLTGALHIGKDQFALSLARFLLCREPSGGNNCGRCRACQLSAAGSHGDFRWLAPQEKSRVIKIDQVREAVDFAGRTAGHGGAKVVVISPAEAMTVNAANALLKCLEEPAPDTYIILVSSRLQRMPATVRSRCQLLRLQTPAGEESRDWLTQIVGDPRDSERWLELAGGAPLLARQLAGESDPEQIIAPRMACRALLAGKATVSDAAGLLAEGDIELVLEQLAGAVRESLLAMDGEVLRGTGGRPLFSLLDEIQVLQGAVAGGANPNRQLISEVLLEKLQLALGAQGAGGSIRA